MNHSYPVVRTHIGREILATVATTDERMNKNQLIALLFAVLMVTSMVAWSASFIF